MLRIGHFVDQYRIKEQGFIYDQIVNSDSRSDRVLTALYTPNNLCNFPEHDVAEIYKLPFEAVGQSALFQKIYARLTNHYLYPSHVAKLTDFLLSQVQKRPIDILHAHFGTAGAKLAPLRKKLTIPLVTTFYGFDASACLLDQEWLKRYELLFKFGDLFVVLSETVAKRLMVAGCPKGKIAVWNIGVDFLNFPRQEKISPAEPIKILCVARFAEKKGHRVLLEAFRDIVRTHSAKLTLVGYGNLLPQIKGTIKKYRLEDSVEIVDTQTRGDFNQLFRSVLQKNDIFVLPSIVAKNGDDEAGPALTMICAQASGMPVVSTPFVGAERSIIDGQTGLLCKPGSAASLAEKIIALIKDQNLAGHIGSLGSDLVRREFSLAGQLGIIENHYKRLLKV